MRRRPQVHARQVVPHLVLTVAPGDGVPVAQGAVIAPALGRVRGGCVPITEYGARGTGAGRERDDRQTGSEGDRPESCRPSPQQRRRCQPWIRSPACHCPPHPQHARLASSRVAHVISSPAMMLVAARPKGRSTSSRSSPHLSFAVTGGVRAAYVELAMGVRPPAGHLAVIPEDAGVAGARGDLRKSNLTPVREVDKRRRAIVHVPYRVGRAEAQLSRAAFPPAPELVLGGVIDYGA